MQTPSRPPAHPSADKTQEQQAASQSLRSAASSSSSSISSASSSRPSVLEGPIFLLAAEEARNRKSAVRPSAESLSAGRRYKNSPFGLRRHFITMPDESGSYTLETAASAAAAATRGAGARKWSSRSSDKSLSPRSSLRSFGQAADIPRAHRGPEEADDDERCDLSVLASSSAAGDSPATRPRWPLHPLEQPARAKELCSRNADELDQACGGRASHLKEGAGGGELELDKSQEECNSLLVRFSSIMYATFLVILGCILHVSELRQKSKNSTDHIYTTIVALVGILWLMFLQADLQRYKRYASKYILIETLLNDQRLAGEAAVARAAGPGGQLPVSHSTSSSSASLINDRMSMNTEVTFKKTAYKMYQQRAAAAGRELQPVELASRKSRQQDAGQGTAVALAGSSSPSTHPVPAYKFLHGKMGANFYLKCGMAAFCFGHVIHEGLRFGQQLYFFGTSNVHCRDLAALVAHLVTPLYSFYQLFMMFKYSNLVINRHKVLARFGLMHIIGTSITFWFRTILEEAFEDFVHKMDYFKTNKPHMSAMVLTQGPIQATASGGQLMDLFGAIAEGLRSAGSSASPPLSAAPSELSLQGAANGTLAGGQVSMAQSLVTLMSSPVTGTIPPQIARQLPDSYACAQNTLLTTKSMNALPYLYPFTIEYNLLLAATFLSLYFNIGKIGVSGAHCKPAAPSLLAQYSYLRKPPRNPSFNVNSHLGTSDSSSSVSPNYALHELHHQDQQLEKDLVGEYKSNFVVNADCHSANKGLFCGFFVLLVTLVTIVIFFVTINKPTHVQLGIKINLIQEATLTVLILVVTLAGFKQVLKLNRNPYLRDKVTTDDVLMLIPLPFFFIHSLLSFRAETASMSTAAAAGSNSGAQNTGPSSSSVSQFNSILMQKNNFNHHDDHRNTDIHRNDDHDLIATSNSRNLQTIMSSTNNNAIIMSNNGTQTIESRSNLEKKSPSSNGTHSRFVENLLTSSIGNSINGNNSNKYISNSSINSVAARGNGRHVSINRGGGGGREGWTGDDNNINNVGNLRLSSRSGGHNALGRNISNHFDDANSGFGGGGESKSAQVDHFKLITVALNIIVMIEVLVQTNFIIDGMRRCSESRYLRFKKPGRELITFAILLNITYWIVATFETKSVEQYKTEIEYYGPLPYMFISHTTLPVMLFYRYHSSVCLAEIWNRAYKPPKRR